MQATVTVSQFQTLSDLFDFYNAEIFNNQLPDCLVNLSRHKGAHGFYAPECWKSAEKEIVHEISVNPDTMYRPDVQWHSTLVHEMVHHWQQVFGNPSRTGYHNKEWANKMEQVGLMPSTTGKAGGKKTGQSVTHYVIEGGSFDRAFSMLSIEAKKSLKLKYLPNLQLTVTKGLAGAEDEESTSGEGEGEEKVKKAGKKFKYSCSCGNNVWGKSGLNINCQECESEFIQAE